MCSSGSSTGDQGGKYAYFSELHRTRDTPEIANTVYDGYLCAAEFMLYDPTPYAEVIDVARDLQLTARRSGCCGPRRSPSP